MRTNPQLSGETQPLQVSESWAAHGTGLRSLLPQCPQVLATSPAANEWTKTARWGYSLGLLSRSEFRPDLSSRGNTGELFHRHSCSQFMVKGSHLDNIRSKPCCWFISTQSLTRSQMVVAQLCFSLSWEGICMIFSRMTGTWKISQNTNTSRKTQRTGLRQSLRRNQKEHWSGEIPSS